jgi:hypothetical protein
MIAARHPPAAPTSGPPDRRNIMAVISIHEFDAGADRMTTNYDAVSSRLALADEPAEGLIAHAAGFSGGTFRMVEIWESAELEERFVRERLMPAVRERVGDGASSPTTERYELHNLVAPGAAVPAR